MKTTTKEKTKNQKVIQKTDQNQNQKKDQKSIVEVYVLGGVVQDIKVENYNGIVLVYDYDIDSVEEDRLSKDKHGEDCIISEFDFENNKYDDKEKLEILQNFQNNLLNNMEDLDPEIQKTVDENFTDLLA